MNQKAIETARKNARSTIINSFLLSSSSFMLPIWQLFYTQHLGMTLTQSMVLSASSWVVTALLNIPTGVWADKYGRVSMFRIGLALVAIAHIPMFFTQNYAILLGFSIIAGIAGAVIDGSLEANVMDSYEAAGLSKEESGRFGSNQMVATYIARIGAGIVGAWLYVQWAFGPLLADLIILTLALVQSFMIYEMRSEKPSELPHFSFLKKVFSDARQSRVVALLFVFTLLVSIGCESFWAAFQQYLSLRNIPAEAFGILFGIIAATSAFSAWLYRHTSKRWDWRWMTLYTIVFASVGILLAHLTAPFVPVLVACVIGLGFGTIYPVAYDVIQRNVRSQYRATVTSIRQFLYTGGFALATVAVGMYVDSFGRAAMLNILTAQLVAVAVVAFGLIVIDDRRSRA